MTAIPASLRLARLFTGAAIVVPGTLFAAGAVAADLTTAVGGS